MKSRSLNDSKALSFWFFWVKPKEQKKVKKGNRFDLAIPFFWVITL